MSKGIKTITIIIIIALILVGIWYIYNNTHPSKAEIENSSTKVIIPPVDVLSSDLLNQLKNFNQNGSLPIGVGAGEKGRTNPFASF